MLIEKVPYPNVKILLIEDNPGDIRLIKELLSEVMDFKHDFISTTSLSEGLKLIENESFDVILLDLSLPDSNGFETIIRTREKSKNVPIVILTGLNDENYARKAVQAGAQDYLIKGQIDSNPLVRSIFHAIDRHKMMQTIESLAFTLQKNETQLKEIINMNADSIVIVDKTGIVCLVNPAAEEFFRRKRSSFIGEFFEYPSKGIDKNEIEIVGEGGQIAYAEMRSVEIEWENSKAYLLSLRDISERKRFEQRLKDSEEKYRILVENSLEGIWAIDSNNNTTFVNQRMAEILGYSVEEMLGKPLFYFMDEQGKKLAELNVERRKQGIKETHDFEFIRKDSSRVYTRLETSPLMKEDGTYNGAIAYVADVTDKRIAEEKLKESEKKYRDLFENSPYPIIILNLDGVIIDVNSSLEHLTGYIRKEIIKKPYKKSLLFSTNYLPLIDTAYNSLLKGETPEPIEIKFNKKNNEVIWLNLNFSLMKLSNDTLIHILIQNITEIKQSKQELKKLEKSLQEIDALIEHAPLAIFLIHQDGKILRANDAAINFFEYTKDELLNLHVFDLFEKSNLERAKKYYNEIIYDLSKGNKIEATTKKKKGRIFDVEITSTIIKIEDQIIIQSFFSDITERKEFEKSRQLLLDQVFASLEFRSKFFTSLSHELRTPLNSILGFSQLLLEQSYGNLNGEQKDFLNDINSAGNHLLTLINSILDLSKIEAGKLELNLEKVELKSITNEVNSIIKPLYDKKGLKFVIEGIHDNDILTADSLRFKQILYNLLSNAINFTKKGTILFKGIERADHWEFQVKDTGIGIKKEDYDIIFKEFGRIHADLTEEVQGAGLGLALTKRLVQLHGGDIWFESEVGKGTTFYFTIPKHSEDLKLHGRRNT